MSVFKALSYHFHTLFKLQNPRYSYDVIRPLKPSFLPSIFDRTLTFSTPIEEVRIQPDEKEKNPLHILFKEAVGVTESVEYKESQTSDDSNESIRRLRKLERTVRKLRANSIDEDSAKSKDKRKDLKEDKPKSFSSLFVEQKTNNQIFKPRTGEDPSRKLSTAMEVKEVKENDPQSLSLLFTNQKKKTEKLNVRSREDPLVCKELSPTMEGFMIHLYKEGYFKNANFLRGNKLDFSCFENRFGRDYIKHAAEQFGKINQNIVKWLSASDLKKVALFGCSSTMRKNVFPAKILRKFFEIQEDTVCSRCVLKESCKYVNQSVWRGNVKNPTLHNVMNVVTPYALEYVSPTLVVPDEVKDSANRIIEEALKLSKTVS